LNQRFPSRVIVRPPRAARSLPCFLLLLPSIGCAWLGRAEESWSDRRSTREWIDQALDAKQPDDRRRAVERLARGTDAGADVVLQAMNTIARTDSDAMVRTAAVRGLGVTPQPRSAATLVKILRSQREKIADALPADAPVRWEAARVLERWSIESTAPAESRESILTTLIEGVQTDPDRNVRLSCLSALGSYPDRRTPPVLVEALRGSDFAARDRAEQSLQRLTGQSFEHDPAAWERWLGANNRF